MDYLACLLLLQFYETTVEGRFVDSTVILTTNMNLECIYPKTGNITQMSWVKSIATGKETIAVFHPMYGVHIQDQYKDRVRFINASSKDKSLNFMKTTEADLGFYFCSITFADGIWEKVIQVIQSDSFKVPHVPPANRVTTEAGGNVTLRCPFRIGALVQQVTWERIKVDRRDTVVLCNLSDERTYGSDYQQHAVTDCTPQKNSILLLRNITAYDSGIYRCHYSLTNGGNKTHVMSLTVPSVTLDHHWHVLLVAGGASAAVLLLLTILIISIILVYRRKKKRRIMKALSKILQSTQTRPSNSYGRSHFHGKPHVRSGEESISGQSDEIYINYRDFSRKPKTRA